MDLLLSQSPIILDEVSVVPLDSSTPEQWALEIDTLLKQSSESLVGRRGHLESVFERLGTVFMDPRRILAAALLPPGSTGGVVAGFCDVWANEPYPGELSIQAICVRENMRFRGIGRKLLMECQLEFGRRDMGACKRVWASVFRKNISAQLFFEQIGFEMAEDQGMTLRYDFYPASASP